MNRMNRKGPNPNSCSSPCTRSWSLAVTELAEKKMLEISSSFPAHFASAHGESRSTAVDAVDASEGHRRHSWCFKSVDQTGASFRSCQVGKHAVQNGIALPQGASPFLEKMDVLHILASVKSAQALFESQTRLYLYCLIDWYCVNQVGW